MAVCPSTTTSFVDVGGIRIFSGVATPGGSESSFESVGACCSLGGLIVSVDCGVIGALLPTSAAPAGGGGGGGCGVVVSMIGSSGFMLLQDGETN